MLTYFYVHQAHRETMTPLVVEEPIPAGCSVPKESVQGGFDHMVIEPDRLTLYYREGRYADTIRYELHGRFPGRYRALPTRFYGAERPDLLAHGPTMKLAVNPRGAAEPGSIPDDSGRAVPPRQGPVRVRRPRGSG